jgi:hypothetical protein
MPCAAIRAFAGFWPVGEVDEDRVVLRIYVGHGEVLSATRHLIYIKAARGATG